MNKDFIIEAIKDIGVLIEGSFHYMATSKRKAKKIFREQFKGWKVVRIKNGNEGSSIQSKSTNP